MKNKTILWMFILILPVTKLLAQEKDTIIQLPTVTVTASSKVTKEVNSAFAKAFPDAQNLKWYTLDKDYLAKFISNDMNHNTLYKKNGYLKYDISFGKEKDLPENNRKKVQDSYQEFTITRVANVKESGRNIWVVNLESQKNYVLVRMEEDEMEEVQKIAKGN